MTDIVKTDICVIGAGSGGLTVAAGAAQMGARVVLIEKAEMGGDCLNTGCVPSKALLAAAQAAQTIREAGKFGIAAAEPDIDFARVRAHVRGIVDEIAPMDSQERFEGLGVRVVRAPGRFTGPREVAAGSLRIHARRFVIATGSSPAIPDIPGIETVPFLTNETVFDLDRRPDHLVVIGGGPIAVELAQAFRRLGSRVTILQRSRLLRRDDSEAVDVVRRRLLAEGVAIREGVNIREVRGEAGGLTAVVENADGRVETVEGTHLLVAAGRIPNTRDLGLAEAGIETTPQGIAVDARLRTTNTRVHAIGDVAGLLNFTHVAGYHGGIVLRNALFNLPAKARHDAVPWVTYSDPELAHVGLTDRQATESEDGINVLRWSFHENDRARAERATDGFIKVVTDRKGRILGATIVGRHAGELILPWVLAVGRRDKIGAMAGVIAPYPTLSEVSKRAAGSYYAPKLFSDRIRRVVSVLQRF